MRTYKQKLEFVAEVLAKRINLYSSWSPDTVAPARIDEDKKLLGIVKNLLNEPVNDELEKAARNYMKASQPPIWGLHEGFIAGAEWQREQMLKQAVEGWVEEPECLLWRVVSNDLTGEFVVKNNLHHDDQVKIIIIKEV